MTTEDFTTYTVVDPTVFTITAPQIIGVYHRDRTSYVYKDKDSGHFHDFTHLVDVQIHVTDGDADAAYLWAVTNKIGEWITVYNDNTPFCSVSLFTSGGVPSIWIRCRGGSGGFVQINLDGIVVGTWYYLKIVKSGTTVTVYVYTDSGRTTQLSGSPISVTLDSDPAGGYQYIYGGQTENDGVFPVSTCYTANLDLQESKVITYSTESIFKKLGVFTTNPIDALFKKLDIPTLYSIDITFALARQYSIDLLLKQIYGLTTDYSIDTLIKILDIPSTFSIDMILENMRQYYLDTQIKKLDLTTIEQIDLQLILKNLTTTNSIDSRFKKLDTQSTFGLDVLFSSSPSPTTVTVDSIELDFIIKFERVNKKTTFTPEWVNQTEAVETYMWWKSLLELEYAFRATEDTKWSMDQSFRNHTKVYLTDYIHNLFGSVWISKIESKWNPINWERPWDTTIHLLAMPTEISPSTVSVTFDSTGHYGIMTVDGTTKTLPDTETLDAGIHDVYFTPNSGTFEWLLTGRINEIDSSGNWITIFVYGSGTVTASST